MQLARTRAPEPIDHHALDDLFGETPKGAAEADDGPLVVLEDDDIFDVQEMHAQAPLQPDPFAQRQTMIVDEPAAVVHPPMVESVIAAATTTAATTTATSVPAEVPTAEAPRRVPLAERFSWSDVELESESPAIGLAPTPPLSPFESAAEDDVDTAFDMPFEKPLSAEHETPPAPLFEEAPGHAADETSVEVPSVTAVSPHAAAFAAALEAEAAVNARAPAQTFADREPDSGAASNAASTFESAGVFAEEAVAGVTSSSLTVAPEMGDDSAESGVAARAPLVVPASAGEITHARLAPLWQRGLAAVIDLLPVAGVTALTLVALEPVLERAHVPLLPRSIDEFARFWWALGPKMFFVVAAVFGTALVYHAVSFVVMQGTVGDLLFGIVWITKRGRKPGLFRALWRGLCLVVSVALFGGGFWFALLTRSKRTFYDVVSGVYPVKRSSLVVAPTAPVSDLPLAA